MTYGFGAKAELTFDVPCCLAAILARPCSTNAPVGFAIRPAGKIWIDLLLLSSCSGNNRFGKYRTCVLFWFGKSVFLWIRSRFILFKRFQNPWLMAMKLLLKLNYYFHLRLPICFSYTDKRKRRFCLIELSNKVKIRTN